MILITRPIEQSESTQKKLSKLGFESRVCPLLEIMKLDHPDIIDHSYDAIIITSQHAAQVALGIQWLKDKKAFLVGTKSAKILNGFDIKYVAKDGTDLLKHLQINLPTKSKLLFICGDFIADHLDTKLKKVGFRLTKSVVYKSVGVTALDPEILNGVKKILFYSPRTAEIFLKVYNGSTTEFEAICISSKTAESLSGKSFKSIKIAEEPNEDSMLKLLV